MLDIKINKSDSILHEIGTRWNTDKAYHKNHTYLYEGLFRKYNFSRNKKLKILELGVSHGFSHLMWHEYFFNSTTVGVDHWELERYYIPKYMPIKHQQAGWYTTTTPDGVEIGTKEYIENLKKNDDRFDLFVGDQCDPTVLDRVAEKYGEFDIIIDDASHQDEKTKESFKFLFPRLKSGGLYIIEDCEHWGSKVQLKVRDDLLKYSESSPSSFKYLDDFKEIEFAELLFSKNYIEIPEDFVLGVIKKK